MVSNHNYLLFKTFYILQALLKRRYIIIIKSSHYHKIGLLPTSHIADNGYRFYDRQALATLQTILLFKEMGSSLIEIAIILPLSKTKQKDILIDQR